MASCNNNIIFVLSYMTVTCFCPFIEYKNQCLGKITMQKYTSTDATPEMFTKVSFVWNMLTVISMYMLN